MVPSQDPEPRRPTSPAAGELLEAASRGDPPALERLVSQYLPQVRAFVRLRVGPEIRARESDSDIVQSVCRELVEGWDGLEYRSEEAFRAWLFTAALNKIREKGRFHRRARRDPGREADGEVDYQATLATPSRVAMGREANEMLERIMDDLPEDYRTVITLCRIAKLPHDIVAERMGRSVGAVRQLLGRALLRLADDMRRVDGGSS